MTYYVSTPELQKKKKKKILWKEEQNENVFSQGAFLGNLKNKIPKTSEGFLPLCLNITNVDYLQRHTVET